MLRLITSESVTEGHPDKIADQISDAILDEILAKDPKSRVAIETMITNGICIICGEVTTDCYVDMAKIARQTIKNIGYTDSRFGFHWETSGVMVAIKEQSSDIARGVDSYISDSHGKILKEDLVNLGAGDQGMVFGYACTDTPELMPLPITLAHKLTEQLAKVRKNGVLKWLRPDGKSQVSVSYQAGSPYKVEKILIAAQHEPEIPRSKIKDQILKFVIEPVIFNVNLKSKIENRKSNVDWQANTKKHWKDVEILINTTGKFVIGGPQGDTGLTGRKNIVDTYGGVVPHGGGALSGKDPTKVDRSGQYAARWVAKNIVVNKLAKKCLVGISYAIGQPKPFSISVDTFGTGLVADEKISKIINKNFDLRPGMIIKNLDLRRPIYQQTASYGHFGRPELDLPWEKIIKLNL